MPLLETAILSIGSAIAKGVLRYWLGSESAPIQEQLWDSLVDVLKGKTSDVLAQRSAERQFDVIAEKSAANIIETINIEGRGISEERAETLVKIASKAVSQAVASPSLIVKNNLEPTQLLEHMLAVIDRAGITETIEGIDQQILEEILFDASQHIVDIASQLPGFTETTFSEILKRENLLLERADKILEEIQRLHKSTRNITAEAAAFENDIRRDVARRLDELQLFGVDVSSSSKRYKLSVAYVSLMVEEVERNPSRKETNGSGEEGDEDVSEAVSVEDALLKGERLLVRGAAGSGKTTLLQWVAVTSASRMHSGNLSILNECIPFFIRLRDLGEALPAPEHMVQLASPHLAGKMPHGWAHNQLETGSAIVLVDGLDEVEDKRRAEVKDWLKSLTENFPKCRYIVSTRPHAAAEGWLDAEEFVEVEMQDMTNANILSFIDHWHASVKEVETHPDKKLQLEELRTKLGATLQNNSALRRLATSPLLCALICALHRDRIENLPTRRVELYRACVDMFLRRDIERKIGADSYPRLDETQKRTILQELALWMMRGKLSQVSTVEADKRIEITMRSLQSTSLDAGGEKIRKLFVERSGILRQPTVNTVDFPHKTFQEYLAAQAALDDLAIKELISHAQDDQWHETIILAAGLARPSEAEELVAGLIGRGDEERKRRHTIYMLAVAAQQGIVKLAPESTILQDVKQRLKKVVPPKNLTEAKALSAAGDLVVPYLGYKRQVLKAAIPNIRCLALVGSSAAYRALEAYSKDSRLGILEELEKSQKYVNDPAEFAERFLYGHWFAFTRREGGCRRERVSLKGKQLRDISPLRNCQELKELDLSETLVEDVSPLRSCTRLTFLNLIRTRVSDLSPLINCERLTKLYLSHSQVDLSTLGDVSSLEAVVIGGVAAVDVAHLTNNKSLKRLVIRPTLQLNLEAIEGFDELEYVDLAGVGEADISPLAKCKNLKELRIRNCHHANLQPLKQLRKLETLKLGFIWDTEIPRLLGNKYLRELSLIRCRNVDLSILEGCQQLESLEVIGHRSPDLRHIASLSNLTDISFRESRVADISALANHTRLRLLDLGETDVCDLAALSSCTELEELSLSGTKVETLDPLRSLTKLTTLNCFGCAVSDISALANLPSLATLNLWNTKVADISPLAGCKKLKYLDLDGTPVRDISPLLGCEQLETLYLRFTEIDDLRPIGKLIAENDLTVRLS